jgi:chloramphenicol 3-O-phosphotransferase
MNTLDAVWSEAGCQLSASGGGTHRITTSGSDIFCTQAESADPDFAVGMLLGPVLCTALALQGVFCLHASAALIDGRAVLFLGDSGAGKSSLADYGQQIGAWQRISDDVTATHSGFDVLPHFPQMKLSSDAQVGRTIPEAISLASVYLLQAADDGKSLSLAPLSQREAVAALVRRTVAARVFSGDLMVRHLDYCAALAASVKVVHVVYPHRREAIGDVVKAVTAANS